MLQPAHVGHLALLRSLIRQGARTAASIAISAIDSPSAEEFFAKLKRALVTGYFVEDVGSGKLATVVGSRLRVLARRPPQRHAAGRLRPLPCDRRRGYELWLAGLDLGRARRRPRPRAAGGAVRDAAGPEDLHRPRAARLELRQGRCNSLLVDFGFTPIGDTARLRWFLHNDAPDALSLRACATRSTRTSR